MRASNQLIEKIKEFEGLHLNAYRCPAGVPTIGAGHTRGVKIGQTITMAQADALFSESSLYNINVPTAYSGESSDIKASKRGFGFLFSSTNHGW